MKGQYTHTNHMKMLDAQLGVSRAQARNLNVQATNTSLLQPGLENEADIQKGPLGPYLPYIQRLIDAAGGASSAYRNFKLPNAR